MKNSAYLISIEPEHSLRRQSFFVENGFNPENFVVFGVVGAALSALDYYRAGVAQAELPLTPSEVGCTESHLAALRHFLDTPAVYAWIFEDDARLKADCSLDLQMDLSAFGSDVVWSVGGVDRIHPRDLKGTIRQDLQLTRLAVMQVHPCFMGGVHGAYAYMVDRKAAQSLLDFHHTPRLTDEWGAFCQSFNTVQFFMSDFFFHPMQQDTDFESYLEGERRIKNKQDHKKYNFRYWFSYLMIKWIFKAKKSYFRKRLRSYPFS